MNALAAQIRRDFGDVPASRDPAWTRPAPLRVVDCVLSLNRNYDRFVVPRLNELERAYPDLATVVQLRALIDAHPSPHAFVERRLRYNHSDRARILSSVVDHLVAIASTAVSQSEIESLESWAANARPDGYKTLKIRGFGIAGFQYLRMLFGANTTKPDVHIIRYVSNAMGRRVAAAEALRLLEVAANDAGVRLRDVDTNIWERSARDRTATMHT